MMLLVKLLKEPRFAFRSKAKDTVSCLSIKKIGLFGGAAKGNPDWLPLTVSFKLHIIFDYQPRKRTPLRIADQKRTRIGIFLVFATGLTQLMLLFLFATILTHVIILLDLLRVMSKGGCMCSFPQLRHLLQGRASIPLPVSIITDCSWGGLPTKMLA